MERTAVRLAGWGAIAGAVVGASSGILLVAAGDYDLLALIDPMRLLDHGSPGLLRFGAVTDMFGYYLLLAPLFLVVGAGLRRRSGVLADLFTLGGLGYALIGATAAGILAAAGADLLQLHADAAGAARDAAAVGFRVVTDAVYRGAWQVVEVIPLGWWALGSGILLRRARPTLGLVGIALGLLTWLFAAVGVLGVSGDLGAWVVLPALPFGVLFWVYTLWLAIILIRDGDVLATIEPQATRR